MKKILLITAVSLLSTLSFSQENWRPVDSGSYWEGRTSHTWFQTYFRFYTLEMDYDTTIADQTYSKFYYDYGEAEGEYFEQIYFCSFRMDEDEKAVYLLPKDSDEEFIFFDFGREYELDDTVYNQIFYPGNVEDVLEMDDFVIRGIDSLEVDGEYYKTYELTNDTQVLFVAERLINHVGFPFMLSPYNQLKCYGESGEHVFGPKCPYTFEFFSESSNLTENSKAELTVFPNPATSHISFLIVGQATLRIYSMEGKVLYDALINGDDPAVDVSRLSSGLYYYNVSNEANYYSGQFVKE